MPSEYEPFLAGDARDAGERAAAGGDLATVQELFREASGPYLRSFWSWLAWAVVLPAAALATPAALARFGPTGTLFTWSAAILAGGVVEITAIRRAARRQAAAADLVETPAGPEAPGADRPAAAWDSPESRAVPAAGRSPLAGWALRTQGNLSLVGLALSLLLIWQDAAWALPGLWLLLLGHSFYILGGIAFPPFRAYGLLYQLGGIAALLPFGAPLPLFAVTTAAANLWMSWAVWRERHAG
jgi:hypothetical protein